MHPLKTQILSAVDRDMPSAHAILGGRRVRGDHDLNPDDWSDDQRSPENLRLAAVLVPIVEHPEEPTMLLTRRADHLNSHSGQVAFPGGKVEDGETPVEGALREAEEEVGLDRHHVSVAGFLDIYETGTGFRILPVVSFVRPGFSLAIDTGEVATVFEVPLSFLLDSSNHERHSVMWKGKRRAYYAMPYQGQYIWGATAGMIRNMYDRITD